MLRPDDILSLLFTSHLKKQSAETFIDYNHKAQGSGPKPDFKTTFPALLNSMPYRDEVKITIIDNGNPFTFESQKDAIGNAIFFTNWDNLIQFAKPADPYDVTIIIEKKLHDSNAFFIYNLPAILDSMGSLSTIELIQAISARFNQAGSYVFFICTDGSDGFSTRTIQFAKSIEEKQLQKKGSLARAKLWEKLKSICHFSGMTNPVALPEDFDIVDPGPLSATLQQRFKECVLVLSLAIIFDLASIEGNDLNLKLNGYRTFSFSKQLAALDLNELEIYYRIYNWIVSGGSIQDKAGLARNLISLNLGDSPNYAISKTVYNSILSGYKIYERQNIKQYIDLRNKMADQIITFNEKAAKIADGFAGSFQKSALAVASLYASLIIAKVLSSANPIGAFSVGATILSSVFILISLIYFLVSKKEVREDRKRFEDAYSNMKNRNRDLLEEADIDRILNDDKEHFEDLRYIDEKIKWYSLLWIMLLIIFAATTLILFTINQYL